MDSSFEYQQLGQELVSQYAASESDSATVPGGKQSVCSQNVPTVNRTPPTNRGGGSVMLTSSPRATPNNRNAGPSSEATAGRRRRWPPTVLSSQSFHGSSQTAPLRRSGATRVSLMIQVELLRRDRSRIGQCCCPNLSFKSREQLQEPHLPLNFARAHGNQGGLAAATPGSESLCCPKRRSNSATARFNAVKRLKKTM